MNKVPGQTTILTQRNDVASFVDDVIKAADSDKNSLGFYPVSAYREYANKGNLFVAISEHSDHREYAGHLLFDLRQPRAKVLQVFVDSTFRRFGVGAQLVKELKRYLTDLQYISIEARVAEDMVESNAFWQDQGFHVQRVEPGGKSRGKRVRMIVVRSHELASPQLFGISGISTVNPFGLSFATGVEKPTYLLDMNVLFDLGPRRQRRSDVINLFRAERMQVCCLAISSEVLAELKRTGQSGKTDAMLDFASILPTYVVPDGESEQLISELGTIVFPERSLRGTLTANDKSDLRHLYTAIAHGLEGLVTSDSSILDAASALRAKYSIDILSPAAFSLGETYPLDGTAFGSESDRILALSEAHATDDKDIRALLSKWHVENSKQLAEWVAVDANHRSYRRYVVRCSGDLIGYLTWHQRIGQACVGAMMAVEENSTAATDCVRLMLSKLSEQILQDQIVLMRLGFPPAQSLIRREAVALGFTASDDSQAQLQKIVVKGVVTSASWQRMREQLITVGGVRLPADVPTFRHVNQLIEIHAADGNRTHLPLLKLESLLAPGLFCLHGRRAVITPVRRQFSEQLLQHLPQASLLPQSRVQLYQQRHYLSHPKTLPKFVAGSLIFFYESQKHGGLGAIIAVGRVVRSYLQDRDAMGHAELDPSVFEPDQLETIGKTDTRTVTVFDNLNIFPQPVFGDTLKALGCGAPVKLLSTQAIDSEQIATILAKAYTS
ncbi:MULTISPECIES: GNAT family N-acetyltransferase [Burkholderia cepacia complex]|uniref:GNAT family N-acetyltransferase n=1 Tax=Burkholderia cepacia complex TaxID=87882 RepID=UPI0009BD6AF7|nr:MULTISPECIES: GNAT family N-acetyltransferase [Burkholderia cepacia complex]